MAVSLMAQTAELCCSFGPSAGLCPSCKLPLHRGSFVDLQVARSAANLHLTGLAAFGYFGYILDIS